MNITLKIYDGRKVVKEYNAETIDFSFGVVEDILDVLDFEHMESKTDIAAMIIKCSKQLRPFLKDIFDGLTDEEVRNTRIQNLVEVFRALYNHAVGELGETAAVTNSKN